MQCPKCSRNNQDDSRFCSKCGHDLKKPTEPELSQIHTLASEEQELTTGATFAGRYHIIEELGRGGMGRVYRALDKELDEEVALKLIRHEIAADRSVIERFKSEIKLARKISHKNVGRVHELMEYEGTRFITMEYVPGEDLKGFVRRAGQLSSAKAIDIANQIAQGLTEAHRLGIVHRDLKPQNIMIDRTGGAKILDFGIAKSLDVEGQTCYGVMIGTPGYMSPEQIAGSDVDKRSDLYSLGAMLFEMLTGKAPFAGETPLDVLLKQKSDTPPDPTELNLQTPAHLRTLIFRCLEKDKEKRCGSTEEFMAALNEQTAQSADIHTPSPLESQTPKPLPQRKKKLLFPALAVVLFALLTVLYFLFFQKSDSPKAAVSPMASGGRWQNSIAVLPFRDFSPAKDQANLAFGMTDAINDRLARFRGLKVIATTSVLRFKDTDKDIKDIGQELGVAHILEGSLQIEGEQIRVRAQLVNAQTGFQLWSETYERHLDSIFDVQDEVSSSIMEALKIELTSELQDAFKIFRPQNMEAYKLYLHGMNILQSRFLVTGDETDFQAADAYLVQAAELSPNEVLPFFGLTWAHAWRSILSGQRIPMDNAIKYNIRAMEINPELGEAIGFLAYVDLNKNDFESALQRFEISFASSPNSPAIFWVAGVTCRVAGLYHQSQFMFDRGQELDPMQPYFPIGQAQARFYLGDFEGALPYFEKNIHLTRNVASSAVNYIHCLLYLGRMEEAQSTLARWEETSGENAWWATGKALLHAFSGKGEEALAVSKSYRVYATLGMKEEALQIIENSMDSIRSFPYLSLINLPVYNSLRDDPRFEKILEIKKAQYEELAAQIAWLEY